jgi:hypothetical protein
LRSGEVDWSLCGRVITPGDGGIEVVDEVQREAGGEGFAVEFGGKAGGEILEHDETDEEGVARSPGRRLVVKEAEFEWEMRVLECDGGVDSGGVLLEEMKLVGWESGDGTVGCDAELERALETVVGEEWRAEDLGECAGGVAAEGIHLPETVLRGDEALGDEEVVERGGADMGDAVIVALDGDGRGEARKGDGAVQLREGVADGLAKPVARDDESDSGEEDDEDGH